MVILIIAFAITANAQLLVESFLTGDCTGVAPEQIYYTSLGTCFATGPSSSIRAVCADGKAAFTSCSGSTTCGGTCITTNVDSGKCASILITSLKLTCFASRPYGNKGDAEVTTWSKPNCEGPVIGYSISSSECQKGESSSKKNMCVFEGGKNTFTSQIWTSSNTCPASTAANCKLNVRSDGCVNNGEGSSKLTGCGAHTYFLSLVIVLVAIVSYVV